MIPDRPFIVDRWYLWSDGELRKQRFRYGSEQEAEQSAVNLFAMGDTTRIRLSKDSGFGGKPAVMKVWEK